MRLTTGVERAYMPSRARLKSWWGVRIVGTRRRLNENKYMKHPRDPWGQNAGTGDHSYQIYKVLQDTVNPCVMHEGNRRSVPILWSGWK